MARQNAIRKSAARRRMKGPWEPIKLLRFEEMTAEQRMAQPPWCTRIYANNKVVVQVADEALTDAGLAIRAMVQKWDDTPISWATLQRVKNEVFGPNTWAVQYFPAEDQLIDQFNFYWLWVFPGGQLPMPIDGGTNG